MPIRADLAIVIKSRKAGKGKRRGGDDSFRFHNDTNVPLYARVYKVHEWTASTAARPTVDLIYGAQGDVVSVPPGDYEVVNYRDLGWTERLKPNLTMHVYWSRNVADLKDGGPSNKNRNSERVRQSITRDVHARSAGGDSIARAGGTSKKAKKAKAQATAGVYVNIGNLTRSQAMSQLERLYGGATKTKSRKNKRKTVSKKYKKKQTGGGLTPAQEHQQAMIQLRILYNAGMGSSSKNPIV